MENTLKNMKTSTNIQTKTSPLLGSLDSLLNSKAMNLVIEQWTICKTVNYSVTRVCNTSDDKSDYYFVIQNNKVDASKLVQVNENHVTCVCDEFNCFNLFCRHRMCRQNKLKQLPCLMLITIFTKSN